MEDKILCPLVDEEIFFIDCMENRELKKECIPDKFKKKDDWQDICKNCKYFIK